MSIRARRREFFCRQHNVWEGDLCRLSLVGDMQNCNIAMHTSAHSHTHTHTSTYMTLNSVTHIEIPLPKSRAMEAAPKSMVTCGKKHAPRV